MTTPASAIRIARCPKCGASSRLDTANAFRPFCSERCKLLDLGAWLDGRHAIPVVEEEPDGDPSTD
jgi:endogenous inhibitor of DNA gyrase (YacG/DUF329 family)